MRPIFSSFLFLAAAALGARSSSVPMIVSSDWLARRLDDPTVVVIQVVHDASEFRMGHIPGARQLVYESITTSRDSVGMELPSAEQLRQLFEGLGVSDASHVVLYTGMSGMGPMASRAFLTLDFVGLARVSILAGGLARWRADGRPVTTTVGPVARGRLSVAPRAVTVDASWVSAHLGKPGVAFIDTRTTPEYLGGGTRGGLKSLGHIPGARQLESEQLFANADSSIFLDATSLAKLYADRSSPGDTIVTYCLVGYRASMTYFGARLLGLPVRLYDGSYQDWARRALPVRQGQTP